MTLRLSRCLVLLVYGCLIASSTGLAREVQTKDPINKKNQYILGLTTSHEVVQINYADIDKDGEDETIISYREIASVTDREGGVLVLATRSFGSVVEWHAFFEKAFPEKTKFDQQQLTVELVQTIEGREENIIKRFLFGRDFTFRSRKEHPFTGTSIEASSTLKKTGIAPGNVFDRRLDTSWAENAEGTGVGERITFEFKKPVNLGLIGILHGKYPGQTPWRDNNRLHRAQVTTETVSDRYEGDSELDLESDLGLGLYGDQTELHFSNKPVMHYFKLKKQQVLNLEIEITSVLLGNETDDAYISEVDFAELIPIADSTTQDTKSRTPSGANQD